MTLTPDATTPAGAYPDMLSFEHDARIGPLWPIVIVNALLNIVTLSLYRFWAKTRVRRFLWSGTKLLDDRFEYTGTGKELFLGFLIVLLVIFLPLIVVNTVATAFAGPAGQAVVGIIIYPGAMFLLGVALYRARRYRLSRTTWRGIRPALVGSEWRYGLMYLGLLVLNLLTLGWAYPWSRLKLTGRMMNNTYFGDRPFRFEGVAGPLYGRFAVYWIGGLVALIVAGALTGIVAGGFSHLVALGEGGGGKDKQALAATIVSGAFGFFLLALLPIAVLYAWYKAKELSYLAECTTFEGLRFRFQATAWSLVRLVIGNVLVVVFTLAFGQPFAQLRNFRYLCRRLDAYGQVDFEAIRQSAAARPSVGEGLADAFDVGSV